MSTTTNVTRHGVEGARRLPVPAMLGLVVAAIAALVGAGLVVPQPVREPVPGPQSVPVASTALVCPAPLATGDTLATTITLASATVPLRPPTPSTAPAPSTTTPATTPPAASPSASAAGTAAPAPTAPTASPASPASPSPSPTGSAGIGPLGSGAFTPVRVLDDRDTGAAFTVTKKATGPVLATGTGQYAPGLAADQLTRGADGSMRGLAVQPCGPAVSRAWFIGASSAVGRTTTVYLSNVEDQPALVDIRMYGTGGELEVPAARGVVVPPRGRTVLVLSQVAPAQQLVALHVIAREGRVSPAVLDNAVAGREPRGIEYLPLTAAGRRLVLPAVLPGDGPRELMLLAPREDAEVAVSMLTADGRITPVGLESVSLQAGKVTRVRIEEVTAKQPVGLVLDAPTRIVAGIHMGVPGQLPDTADVAGTPALRGPAVVTGLPAGKANALVLAAPGQQARVRLTVHGVGPAGSRPIAPVTRELTVPAGTTLATEVVVPAGAGWAWVLLEPEPGSGRVHVVRRTTEPGSRGVLVTLTPVHPLTPSVDIPTALHRISAG